MNYGCGNPAENCKVSVEFSTQPYSNKILTGMAFHPNIPFNELPLLPPEKEILTPPVQERAEAAERALAELKRLGQSLGAHSFLMNALMLHEAKDNSEIENIFTSHDAVFRAAALGQSDTDPATREVLRCHEAFVDACLALERRSRISTDFYVAIVQKIKNDQSDIRRVPGARIIDFTAGKIVYAPPEGESLIREKLKNLEDFIHAENGLDPIIRLPLVHYQFEAIHPFPDGNGRAGRILNILFLMLHRLIDYPGLHLSRYILKKERDYYRLLHDVSEKEDWEPWMIFMLSAVEETAIYTRDRILAIRGLMDEAMETAIKGLPGDLHPDTLVPAIFRQPYSRVCALSDAGVAGPVEAEKALRALERIGLVKCVKQGGENLYLNERLFELLIQ